MIFCKIVIKIPLSSYLPMFRGVGVITTWVGTIVILMIKVCGGGGHEGLLNIGNFARVSLGVHGHQNVVDVLVEVLFLNFYTVYFFLAGFSCCTEAIDGLAGVQVVVEDVWIFRAEQLIGRHLA